MVKVEIAKDDFSFASFLFNHVNGEASSGKYYIHDTGEVFKVNGFQTVRRGLFRKETVPVLDSVGYVADSPTRVVSFDSGFTLFIQPILESFCNISGEDIILRIIRVKEDDDHSNE